MEDHKLSVTHCPHLSGIGAFMSWFIRRRCLQACLKVAEANLIRKKWHDSSRRFRHGLWIADKQNEVLQRCHFLHSPPRPHPPTHMGFWKWHWEEEVALNLIAWARLWIAGICCCFCGACVCVWLLFAPAVNRAISFGAGNKLLVGCAPSGMFLTK